MNGKVVLTISIIAVILSPIVLTLIQFGLDDCTQDRYEGYIENMLRAQKYNDNIIFKMLEEQKEWIKGQQGKALELEGSWMSERDKRNDAYIKASNFLKKKCDAWNVFFMVIVILALIFAIVNSVCVISNKKSSRT